MLHKKFTIWTNPNHYHLVCGMFSYKTERWPTSATQICLSNVRSFRQLPIGVESTRRGRPVVSRVCGLHSTIDELIHLIKCAGGVRVEVMVVLNNNTTSFSHSLTY